MTKTFGDLWLDESSNFWEVEVEPHVSMKLKQVFLKIAKQDFGTLYLKATDENCRDLLWFIERYPMRMDPSHYDILARRATSYDKSVATTAAILQGSYQLPTFIEMALPPRTYQKEAAALLLSAKSLLLADELGTGKSASALTALCDPSTLPALVVCPAHLPQHWVEQATKFVPHLSTHVIKKKDPYDFEQPDILIASYHKMGDWADVLRGKIRTVIFDECQELRRTKSTKYWACEHISNSQECIYHLGMSATPIYGYGGEFWNVMNVVAPTSMGTREEFLREWCWGGWRSDDKIALADPKAFGTYLRESGKMLLRTKKEIGRELPELSRIVHEVDSNTEALKQDGSAFELARLILDSKADRKKRFVAGGQFDTILRQQTGVAKAPYVAEFVRMLIEEIGDPVVLFGWHRAVYEIWRENLADLDPAFYTGSESSTKKHKEVSRFRAGETKLLVMSLRSGVGLDGLQDRCSRVVIGELDWAFGALEQCIGRIYRDGQTEPVFAYYLIARDGADPTMVDTLGLKRSQIEGVLDPAGELVTKLTVDPEHIRKLAAAYLKGHA